MAATAPSKPEGPTGDFTGDIEVSNKLPSEGDLDRAADMPVVDGSGKAHLFKSLHSSPDSPRRVLIIFIRHFFCGVSNHICIASLRSWLTLGIELPGVFENSIFSLHTRISPRARAIYPNRRHRARTAGSNPLLSQGD